MDIQKEREVFESWWEAFHNGRQISCDYVEKDNSYAVGYANAQWVAWQAAKAQVVPEWIDYTKQSPRIDGRYQIFISGEQITADWQSPFGFSDPVEGEALIQDLISHWGMLPEPPKAQEPAND